MKSFRMAFLAALIIIQAGATLFAETVSLTLLHTNDTHGHLRPFSYPGLVSPGVQEAALSHRANIGGIARRATLVKQIRAEQKQKRGNVWLADMGDFCDGTPFSTEYRGDADTLAMNAVGYDLGVLGNHEFNNTLAQLQKLISLSERVLVCANATLSASGKPLLPSYVIRKVGGLRIGVFGLITASTASYPAAREGVTIEKELLAARKVVNELRGKVDAIVLLSHVGLDVDRAIAREVSGIDVIVGGHSHTRLPVGEFFWASDELSTDRVNGTVIVQAHQWGGELGRLDLLFERNGRSKWRIERYRSRLIPITSELVEDPEVARVVARFWDPIAAKYSAVIGQAAADFTSRGDDMAEYHLAADAVRETMGTELDLENLGGIRAPLVKGPITHGDLVTLDPFNNTVVIFQITGTELKKVLERTKPAVSGIRYRMEDGKLVEVTIGGTTIADDRIYSGSANSYYAAYALKDVKLTDTGRARLDVIVAYIREKGTVRPRYDGRRVLIGTDNAY